MRHRRRIGGIGIVLVLMLPNIATSPLWAQSAPDKGKVDQEIGATAESIESASAEERRLLGLIQQSNARKSDLDAKLSVLDREIGGVQRQLDTATSRLTALESQQRLTTARLNESVAALDGAKATLSRQALAAYTGGSEAASYATMVLGSATMGELASKRSYLRAVVGSQSDTISLAENLRDQVGDLSRQVESSRKDAQAQRDVVAGQRAALQGTRDAQAAVRVEVQTEIAQTEGLRSQVLARKDEFEAQLERLQRQSAAITESLRQRASTPSPAAPPAASGGAGPAAPAPARAPGRLLLPVPGAPITSAFGPRVHPVYGTVRMHTGIDYGADSGTPIRAAGDGVVISSGWLGDYGIATMIDHGGGIVTVYAHQSATVVAAGQRVSAGSTIGRVGSTGASTGPHLHFEVRVDGDPVSPSPYL